MWSDWFSRHKKNEQQSTPEPESESSEEGWTHGGGMLVSVNSQTGETETIGAGFDVPPFVLLAMIEGMGFTRVEGPHQKDCARATDRCTCQPFRTYWQAPPEVEEFLRDQYRGHRA